MDFQSQGPDYLSKMRPMLNKQALFFDYSEDYVMPLEPSRYGMMNFRFRTAKNNVDNVFLKCNGERILMKKTFTKYEYDYYDCIYQLNNEMLYFHFEIESGRQKYYYQIIGAVKEVSDEWNFRLSPGFATPDWAKGAVMYQIFTDRFRNGDPSNDVETGEYHYLGGKSKKVSDWNSVSKDASVRDFYGGDLQGVIDKLDYLEDLGVEVLYFNPLFVSPSNHKYDIQDYDYIDPHFGKIVDEKGGLLPETGAAAEDNTKAEKYINRVTNLKNLEAGNKLFQKLVEEAHKRGMKVILDGVFNHCGSFNKWLDREKIYENRIGFETGAYITKNSPYRRYFDFTLDNWPDNGSYDGWWGHDTLPKLNYEGSDALCRYIMRVGEKWVSAPYNADGWRLDVAADLGHSPEFNHRFWKEFRRRVKAANPNAIILAEHYGDPSAWMQGDEWDSVMNYDAFMEPLTWFLTGMEKHSDDRRDELLGDTGFFWDSIYRNYARFLGPSIFVAMNELSNHDHSRFLTRTNHKVGRVAQLGVEAASEDINMAVMREAVMVQMTWVGAPTVYYGDEAGLTGFTDPDNRRPYPWGREDQELIRYHKALIEIRKNSPELRTGSTKEISREYNILAYGRFSIDEQSIVLINNNDCEKELNVKVTDLGVSWEASAKRLIFTNENGFSTEHEIYPIINGYLKIQMPKTSGMILKVIQ
ncbi:MAG: glycoside hydrolase family 13 protein [Lachnospiraceae bacterium]|nr:glycoside hydrolase family 13 protein [Lachnospiraceae bacterium]